MDNQPARRLMELDYAQRIRQTIIAREALQKKGIDWATGENALSRSELDLLGFLYSKDLDG